MASRISLRDVLGVDVSKQQQLSDWGAEELTDAQIAYAASDVLHLHALKEKLDAMLAREGRMNWPRRASDFCRAGAARSQRMGGGGHFRPFLMVRARHRPSNVGVFRPNANPKLEERPVRRDASRLFELCGSPLPRTGLPCRGHIQRRLCPRSAFKRSGIGPVFEKYDANHVERDRTRPVSTFADRAREGVVWSCATICWT